MKRYLKGTINSIFNDSLPENCTVCVSIIQQPTQSSFRLINSKEYQNPKSIPLAYSIEYDVDTTDIKNSIFFLQVSIVKDNQILCKNELKDQVGKNGRFRHYIDVFISNRI